MNGADHKALADRLLTMAEGVAQNGADVAALREAAAALTPPQADKAHGEAVMYIVTPEGGSITPTEYAALSDHGNDMSRWRPLVYGGTTPQPQVDMTACGHSKYDPCHNCEPIDAAAPQVPGGVADDLSKRIGFALVRVLQEDYGPITELARSAQITWPPDGEPRVAALSAQPRPVEPYEQGYADGVRDTMKSPHYDDSCDTKYQPAGAPVGVEAALRIAYRHLDMGSMRVSHYKDAAAIESALAQQPAATMTREAAVETARACAYAKHDDHDYLPRTRAEASAWTPHEWVIDAIRWHGQQPAAVDEVSRHWKFVEQAFDLSKTSTSEIILQSMGLPDDEPHMPLSWHINRHLAQPQGEKA